MRFPPWGQRWLVGLPPSHGWALLRLIEHVKVEFPAFRHPVLMSGQVHSMTLKELHSLGSGGTDS
jgi:hypothetical protein